MIRFICYTIFLFFILNLFACRSDDDRQLSLEEQNALIVDYISKKGLTGKQTSTGTYYVVLSEGALSRKAVKADQITLSFQGKYLDDIIIPNSTATQKLPYDANYINRQIEEVLKLSEEGDSVKVFLNGDPVIFYDIKIKAIRNETELIDQFVADSSWQTTTTSSGLEYLITAVGTGSTPVAGNSVTVNYSLRSLDGELLDQSQSTGSIFTLSSGSLISGFIEAVLLLKVGGKGKFIMPSSLAYGANGATGGGIVPYQPLYFEIELVKIN